MSDNIDNNLSNKIMAQIKDGHTKMKPKWYFALGSLSMIIGLVSLFILSTFFVSLVTFSIRSHGPMADIRLQNLLALFPWWALITAVIGLGLACLMLKTYDLSYKKNFIMITAGFILGAIVIGWLVDYSGLDNAWIERAPAAKIYKPYDAGQRIKGPGWRPMPDKIKRQEIIKGGQIKRSLD